MNVKITYSSNSGNDSVLYQLLIDIILEHEQAHQTSISKGSDDNEEDSGIYKG